MKGQNTNIGDLSNAIGRFGAVVQQLENLRNDSEDLSGYFVHKAVTALLLWLSGGGKVVGALDVTLPELGLCSLLDINPRVAELPPNPIAYAWLALYWLSRQVTDASFENQLIEISEATRWQDHALDRITESPFAHVRLFARIDAAAHVVRDGPFETVIDTAAKLALEHLRIQAQPDVPLHEPDPVDVNISLPRAGTAEVMTVILPALLAGLIGARAGRGHLDEIMTAWRRRAELYGSGVMTIVECILAVSYLPRAELERVLLDRGEMFESRFIAATLISGSEDSAPASALYAHLVVFDALAHNGLMREFASSSLAVIVRRDWLRLSDQPALLRYPRLHVDDIRSACNAPSTRQGDWPATARILLAVLPAVGLGVPVPIRDRLRAVANGPAPIPGRIEGLTATAERGKFSNGTRIE
jgi:hypothetical protein